MQTTVQLFKTDLDKCTQGTRIKERVIIRNGGGGEGSNWVIQGTDGYFVISINWNLFKFFFFINFAIIQCDRYF